MRTSPPTPRRWPLPVLLLALALPPAALLANALLGSAPERMQHAGFIAGVVQLAPLPGWAALSFAMRWNWRLRTAVAALYLPVLALAALLDGC